MLQSTKDSFNSQIGDTLNQVFNGGTITISTITFITKSVESGAVIPYKNTKNGGNISPSVSWNAISGAETYAFIMNSTVKGSNFLLKNIAKNTTFITENSTAGGVAVVNSYGFAGYSGPEASNSNVTYGFYVYALSAEIVADNLVEFYMEVEKYKIGMGSWNAVYGNSTLLVF